MKVQTFALVLFSALLVGVIVALTYGRVDTRTFKKVYPVGLLVVFGIIFGSLAYAASHHVH